MFMYAWILAIVALLAVDIAALPQDAFEATKECEVRVLGIVHLGILGA